MWLWMITTDLRRAFDHWCSKWECQFKTLPLAHTGHQFFGLVMTALVCAGKLTIFRQWPNIQLMTWIAAAKGLGAPISAAEFSRRETLQKVGLRLSFLSLSPREGVTHD
jgi:hypothetical protein